MAAPYRVGRKARLDFFSLPFFSILQLAPYRALTGMMARLTADPLVDPILHFLLRFRVADTRPVISWCRVGLLRHELERDEVGRHCYLRSATVMS